jgi:multisubunit Na+/H+ antiporter MnhB subunit
MRISNSSMFAALVAALLMGLYGVFYQIASVSSEILAFSRLSIGAIATILYFSFRSEENLSSILIYGL